MSQQYVLVTGASKGIGRSIALSFAEEGYHVFLNSHKSVNMLDEVKEQIEKNGGSATIVPGNVSRSDEVKQIFDKIYNECDCLDILVNNAGVSYLGLLMDMTDDQWDWVIRTNLSSVFYCSRAALDPMVRRQQGRIINISSIWGNIGASCEAAYSATKAGVDSLTKALAKELALCNIQVNAIACGVIDTSMNSVLSDEEKAQIIDRIPAGRFGTTEEVAQLVLQVANAPDYLTGQVIGLDGAF